MKSFKGLVFILLAMSFANQGYSQDSLAAPSRSYGANVGLLINFGTHFQRIGLTASGYYHFDYAQVNGRLAALYNFKALGPVRGWEKQFNIGPVLAFGPKDPMVCQFLGPTGNQTGRRYSVGYSFNLYFDQVATSQRTGSIGLGVGKFGLVHENDLLAQAASDKFRTAAIFLFYTDSLYRVGIKTTLFTGNKDEKGAQKVYESSFARFGYTDLSETAHGRYSHGILALSYEHLLPYRQSLRVETGIDAERVRNIVQNRLMHDMYLWPEKWNKARNLHIPMVDTEGKAYLFEEGQTLRRPRLFLDLSANPSMFY